LTGQDTAISKVRAQLAHFPATDTTIHMLNIFQTSYYGARHQDWTWQNIFEMPPPPPSVVSQIAFFHLHK